MSACWAAAVSLAASAWRALVVASCTCSRRPCLAAAVELDEERAEVEQHERQRGDRRHEDGDAQRVGELEEQLLDAGDGVRSCDAQSDASALAKRSDPHHGEREQPAEAQREAAGACRRR